jgi:hypothetical protein
MATGRSSAAPSFQFMREKGTISVITTDTTSAIPPSNESKWKGTEECILIFKLTKLHRFNRWETYQHKMLS